VAELTELFNLYKYFIWSGKMKDAFDELINESSRKIIPKAKIESNLYMSYWFGSLFVVIEGWRELGLSDERIDTLLRTNNVDLLRRYRNGVFHFQRDYFDERLMGFLRDGVNRMEWIRQLHYEFEQFFTRWADENQGFL
jgi:hypothetical protein